MGSEMCIRDRSKSCHIAVGISQEGDREVLGLLIQDGESEETWSRFFDDLKERGLHGLDLVISDAHKGLVKAIEKSFTGVLWQRCQVYFLRNIFQNVPKKESQAFRERVKAIFRITSIDEARRFKDPVIAEYEDQAGYKKACAVLDEGFEDAFQYAVVGPAHPSRRSTNLLERLNEGIKRREKVVRISPNTASANRLIGAILLDQNDQWLSSSRAYISF